MGEMSNLHHRFKAMTGRSPRGWAMTTEAYESMSEYIREMLVNRGQHDQEVMMTHYEGIPIFIRPHGEPVEMLLSYEDAKVFDHVQVRRGDMV